MINYSLINVGVTGKQVGECLSLIVCDCFMRKIQTH